MKKNIREVIHGEYVATPVKNAFNNQIAYWLSKKNCTLSIYMFTVYNYEKVSDFEERLSQDGFNSLIPMFEERCKRPYNNDVYINELAKVHRNYRK